MVLRYLSDDRIQERHVGFSGIPDAWEEELQDGMVSLPSHTCRYGTVEVDETYVGGKQRGYPAVRRPGFGDSNKEIVIGIRQRGGDLRFFHAEDAKTGTLAKYIQENISEDVDVIITDEYRGYPKAVGNAKHATVNHRRKEYVRLGTDIHTNSIESAFSLLKRGIVGTWHRMSAKHLQAYLDEMCFRFDNRKNPYLFRDTLLKMLEAEHIQYQKLIARGQLFCLPSINTRCGNFGCRKDGYLRI